MNNSNTANSFKVFTNSLQVAQEFGKRHADVLRDIRNLNCSADFHKRNFVLIRWTVDLGQGRTRKDPKSRSKSIASKTLRR